MTYLGLPMFDVPQTNITKYFDQASDFIEEAVTSSNGKWLLNLLNFNRLKPFDKASLHRPGASPLPDGNVPECNTRACISRQEKIYEPHWSFEIGKISNYLCIIMFIWYQLCTGQSQQRHSTEWWIPQATCGVGDEKKASMLDYMKTIFPNKLSTFDKFKWINWINHNFPWYYLNTRKFLFFEL